MGPKRAPSPPARVAPGGDLQRSCVSGEKNQPEMKHRHNPTNTEQTQELKRLNRFQLSPRNTDTQKTTSTEQGKDPKALHPTSGKEENNPLLGIKAVDQKGPQNGSMTQSEDSGVKTSP